jgi:glycosyltransferase involved in cell wall biosynthesis
MDPDYVKYSIIIPAYNEAERLSASLEKILSYMAEHGWAAEILVVNDGSRDNTADVVRSFGTTNKAVKLVENPGNRGKGYSVRHGMLEAQGDVLLFTDADLSSPIYEAEKLFRALEAGADVAIGSRWLNPTLQTEKQPWLRQLYGRLFNLLLRVLLGLKQKDTQCGFKAFNRRSGDAIFPRQHIERWGFDPELLFLARTLGFKVAEVPVEWAHDHRSKINPIRDGARMFAEILAVRWNALRGRYRAPQAELLQSLAGQTKKVTVG